MSHAILSASLTFRLPENILDTEEDNALLRIDGLPQFDQLTPEKCVKGMGKLSLDYESGVWAVEERVKGGSASLDHTLPFLIVINILPRFEASLIASAVKGMTFLLLLS